MSQRRIYLVALFSVLAMAFVLAAAEPVFLPVKVDGPVQDPAKFSFWFGPFPECVALIDMDGDGDLDIANGRNWYENTGKSGSPGFEAVTWVKHTNYRDGAETFGAITDDGGEVVMDVNRDGRPDIIASGWMKMSGVYWYENPGKPGVKWQEHPIHFARSMEGIVLGDIAGHRNGDQDLLINHWSAVQGQNFSWYEHIDKEPWLVERIVGVEGQEHGNGVGDINGDGRNDLVTGVGWWEAPADPRTGKWIWHPDWKVFVGNCGLPVLVYDFNGDGLNDLVIGNAQGYGLKWLEQKKDAAGKRTFVEHWMEEDYSLFHHMALADLDGDGKMEVVTGKILFPHQGRDPGEFDPLFVFWYKFENGNFQRHILSFNHLQWYPDATGNPPPNNAIGVGRQMAITDIDGDGQPDIIVASNAGLYIFYRRGTAPTSRITKNPLPPNNTYPTNLATGPNTGAARREGAAGGGRGGTVSPAKPLP